MFHEAMIALFAAATAQTATVEPATPDVATTREDAKAAPAFEGESDEAVVTKVFAYLESLSTLQGGFTQIAPSGALTTGQFYLKRPGLFRFDYDAPSPLKVVANGGLVYVHDSTLETTDSYPVGKTPLKFLVSRKIDLDDLNVADVTRGENEISVTFASSDPDVEGEVQAVFAAPKLSLREWIVIDPRGGATSVTLRDVVVAEPIANLVFAAPEAQGAFLKNR